VSEAIVTFRTERIALSTVVLLTGWASLILPTLASLAKESWSTEAGAHGPIVLATLLWLVWREKDTPIQRRSALPISALMLVPALFAYAVSRIAGALFIEAFALYATLIIATGCHWFLIAYGLFLIPPPDNWMFAATQPLKMALANNAVRFLDWFDLSVGNTGSMILIDGYRLQVASACSGVNSIIGIGAITVLYAYLFYQNQPRHALSIIAMSLPIAILTNFLRIVFLVLCTHWFGSEIAEGVLHGLAGLGTIIFALLLLVAADRAIHPFLARRNA